MRSRSGISNTAAAARAFIRANGPLTRRQLADVADLAYTTTMKYINALQSEGLIRCVGPIDTGKRSRSQAWELDR